MFDADKKEFMEKLEWLSVLTPAKKKLTQDVKNAYWDSLQKYTKISVISTLEHWKDYNKSFPHIADLLPIIEKKQPNKFDRGEIIQDKFKSETREALEKELTLLSKQICANNTALTLKMYHQFMIKVRPDDTRDIPNLDYSSYKTTISNSELYKRQAHVRQRLAYLVY